MSSYRLNNPLYTPIVYTYDNEDLVQGGNAGVSNKPIKEIANNSAYLRKYKTEIIYGAIDPTTIPTDLQFDLDIFDNGNITSNQGETNKWYVGNLLYQNISNNTFWQLFLPTQANIADPPQDTTGAVWKVINSETQINTNDLRIHKGGSVESSTDYYKLYNVSDALNIEDNTGQLADIKVATLHVDQIDGNAASFNQIIDKEVLINANVSIPSENDDSEFTVKRLQEFSTPITVSEYTTDTGATDDTTFVVNDTAQLSVNDTIQISYNNIDLGYFKIKSIADLTHFTTDSAFHSIIGDDTGFTGSVYEDVSARIFWNESAGYWELKDRNNNLLGLNVNSLIQSGGTTPSYGVLYNRIITNQAEFDAYFNPGTAFSGTVFDVVLLKAGNYNVSQPITISNSNGKLISEKDAIINLTNNITFSNTSSLYFEMNLNYNTANKKIIVDNAQFLDLVITIQSASALNSASFISSIGTSNFNRYKINTVAQTNMTYFLENIDNSEIIDSVIDNNSLQIFSTCTNLNVSGVFNNNTINGNGDFNAI